MLLKKLQLVQSRRRVDPITPPQKLRGDVIVSLGLVVLVQLLKPLARCVSLRDDELSLFWWLIRQLRVKEGLDRLCQLFIIFGSHGTNLFDLLFIVIMSHMHYDSVLQSRVWEGFECLVQLLILCTAKWLCSSSSLCLLVFTELYHSGLQRNVQICSLITSGRGEETVSFLANCCV